MSLLLSDDAPQFQFVTPYQALCWIHEGRHYKKLTPPTLTITATFSRSSRQISGSSITSCNVIMLTPAASAKKLGVSFFAYVYDRVAGIHALPSLAQLIMQQSLASHSIVFG